MKLNKIKMKDNIKNYFERVSNNFIELCNQSEKISNAIDMNLYRITQQ